MESSRTEPQKKFFERIKSLPTPSGFTRVVPTLDAYQQADFVISKIEELYNSGTEYDHIAILYRAHYHAMELQVELSRRGLPFLITSGLAFSSRHM